jgi:GrpB-like predicted nucleotidyltransferase (UPF0157 family)
MQFWCTFRDLLRRNSDVASSYASLKKELAYKYENDREIYTELKWPFIKKALESIGIVGS